MDRTPSCSPVSSESLGMITNAESVVAIINTTPDTVNLLRGAFERAGFVVVSGYTHDVREGKLDLELFLRTHQPAVIVYDVAPPYERNWRFLQHLRATVLQGFRFVIT